MMVPGIVLSQPEMATKASNMLPRATSSMESAITSRLTSEVFMPSAPMVDFRRYDLEGGVGGEGNEGFRRVVHSLLEFFPSAYRPSLSTENVLSLQMDSLGVIGILIDWFVDAISLCLSENARSLEWRHFEMTALLDYKLENLSRQCRRTTRFFGR